jgi:hypothetical protein
MALGASSRGAPRSLADRSASRASARELFSSDVILSDQVKRSEREFQTKQPVSRSMISDIESAIAPGAVQSSVNSLTTQFRPVSGSVATRRTMTMPRALRPFVIGA